MIEDSSFEGWTTTPLPHGVMDYPEGRRLPSSPHAKGYVGELRSQTIATDESIQYAADLGT